MRNSLLKNFSFLTASNILMPVASMALVIAISRLGGVEMLGQYSLLMTFFYIGQTCGTAGLPIIITRDIARDRDLAGAYFTNACAIGAVAVVAISAVLLPSFMWTIPGHAMRVSLVVMALSLLPTVVGMFGESVLLAFEHAEDFVIIGFVESLMRTIVATALVCLGFGIVAIATTILVSRAAAAAAMVVALRWRGARLAWRFDGARVRELARHVPVVGTIPVVNALFWRSDTLILTWLRGLIDVGYYSASTRLLDITRSFPQAYARALYPVLSRLHGEDPTEFRRLCHASLVWIVAGTVPLAVLTCGLAPTIITLLFGEAMRPATIGLQIVAWIMIPYALSSTLAQILFATGNQAFDLRVNVFATIANVGLDLALIPPWGFVGAAIASLAAMVVHVVLQYRYVRDRVEDPGALGVFGRIAVVGLTTWLIVAGLARLGMFVALASGLLSYALGLLLIGVLQLRHVRMARRQLALGGERARSAVRGLFRLTA